MSVKYFLLLVGFAGVLTVTAGISLKMMKRSADSKERGQSGQSLDHHENARLLGEGREEIEVARKAPLTSDKGAADSSFESDEARRLLDSDPNSPLYRSGISSRDEETGFAPYGNNKRD